MALPKVYVHGRYSVKSGSRMPVPKAKTQGKQGMGLKFQVLGSCGFCAFIALNFNWARSIMPSSRTCFGGLCDAESRFRPGVEASRTWRCCAFFSGFWSKELY